MLIGELSKRSKLSKDGLRHYESLGLLHSHPVRAGSRVYRDYAPDSLERLSLIALGKRLGFTLAEMAEPLNRLLSDDISPEERSAVLLEKAAEIDQRILNLKAARDKLVEIAAKPEKPFVDEYLRGLGLLLGEEDW